MSKETVVTAARDMIRRHGLRAQAVAMERIAELRGQHDAAAVHYWEQTCAAIQELRRTAPSSELQPET